jgi:hypothetical protein
MRKQETRNQSAKSAPKSGVRKTVTGGAAPVKKAPVKKTTVKKSTC